MTGPRREHYDPYILIDEVTALLRDRGLTPERVDLEQPGARVTAACMLLRSLNIAPLRDAGTIDLDGQRAYNRRIHGD